MPGKTNSDRILELERQTTALLERVERLRHDLERVEKDSKELGARLQEAEKQQRDLPEKRLEELRARRWDLLKLLLAAILGGVVTIATGLVSKVVDRWTALPPNPAAKK